MNKFIINQLIKFLVIILIFFIFLFFQYKYFEYSTNFSFVDEYDNITSASLMIKHRISLYKDIFRNRAPGPVYISYLIQTLFKPNSLYSLIIYHRIFIIFFVSIIFFIFLYFFDLKGIIFILFFELIKYYLHGNLFLGESILVYPLIFFYLLILLKKNIKYDYLFLTFINFYTFLFREVYLPLSLSLTIIYFYQKKQNNLKKLFLVFLSVFLLIIFFIFLNDFKSFYNQMIKVNIVRVLDNSYLYADNINLVRSLFYPFLLFFGYQWNGLRIILSIISLIFIFLSFYLLFKKKININLFIILWLVLCFSLPRSFTPGTLYYGAYRGLIWTAFLLISSLYLINLVNKKIIFFLFIFIFFIILFTDKNYFLFKKNLKIESFNLNYNKYFLISEIINNLSESKDKIFIDGYSSLIFSLINIRSSYKYFFYYPVVENNFFFDKEKEKALKLLPTFYYIDCLDLKYKKIPKIIESNYLEFFYKNKNFRTCLFINKNKLRNINQKLLDKVKNQYNYILLYKK